MPETVSYKGFEFILYEKSIGLKGCPHLLYLEREPTLNDVYEITQWLEHMYDKGYVARHYEVRDAIRELTKRI